MSIRKLIGMQNGVSDYTLYVAPRWISLPKNSKSFILYLQKGMQVIGKFQRDQNVAIKDSVYRFHSPLPAEFKISNFTNSTYTWTLYSIDPITFQQVFQDSASFNIQRTVKLYQAELSEKEREIQTSFKIKALDKPTVLQLWKNVKVQMKTNKSSQKCIFSTQGYQIKFQIEIRNNLDSQLQKMQRQKQKQKSKLRRSRSRSNNSSNSSDSGKRPLKPVQSKDKIEPIEVNYPQIKYHYNIEEKDKLQLQPTKGQSLQDNQVSSENYNATLRVVNPNGQEITPSQQEQRQRIHRMETDNSSNSSYNNFPQTKKFSLLSDIIQLSFQGSSTYNYPDFRSSNGFQKQNYKKNNMNNQFTPKEMTELNKFKTLAYQSNPNTNMLKNQFRRPKTSDAKSINSSQIQSQSQISFGVNDKKGKVSSGDPLGKWIILIAIIILLGTVLGITAGKAPNKKVSKNKIQ